MLVAVYGPPGLVIKCPTFGWIRVNKLKIGTKKKARLCDGARLCDVLYAIDYCIGHHNRTILTNRLVAVSDMSLPVVTAVTSSYAATSSSRW